MVREFIRERCDVRLSEVSVGRLLRKLALTPQEPLRRAYEQDPEGVAQWLSDEFPQIEREAKRCGAQIFRRLDGIRQLHDLEGNALAD